MDVALLCCARRFGWSTPTALSQHSQEKMSDAVNQPDHYTGGNGIECIAAIRAALGDDGFRDYCAGNVLKYVWRYKSKNGIEDLEKAQVYLGWMIDPGK